MQATGGRPIAKVVRQYLANHSVAIEARRDVVIVSCGGYPYDINLIQAHKALDMAAHACTKAARLFCWPSVAMAWASPDFLKWFDEEDSRALEARLRDAYEVNGQTAWSLLTKAERYRIHLVSELPDEEVRRMRMTPARFVD